MESTCDSVHIGVRVTSEVLSSSVEELLLEASATTLGKSEVSVVPAGLSVEDRLLGDSWLDDNAADGEVFDDDEEVEGSQIQFK
jgi:hypothetical protein